MTCCLPFIIPYDLYNSSFRLRSVKYLGVSESYLFRLCFLPSKRYIISRTPLRHSTICYKTQCKQQWQTTAQTWNEQHVDQSLNLIEIVLPYKLPRFDNFLMKSFCGRLKIVTIIGHGVIFIGYSQNLRSVAFRLDDNVSDKNLHSFCLFWQSTKRQKLPNRMNIHETEENKCNFKVEETWLKSAVICT